MNFNIGISCSCLKIDGRLGAAYPIASTIGRMKRIRSWMSLLGNKGIQGLLQMVESQIQLTARSSYSILLWYFEGGHKKGNVVITVEHHD